MSLDLWNRVCETDPKHTKPFTRFGGFSGTAINATYLIRKATEAWGPMGSRWGVRIADEQYVPGAPVFGPDGNVVGCEQIHVLRIELWYPNGDQTGVVTQFGQTTFVGRNKNGMYTDEEAPKKSLTDATTKALAMLGFAADVHLGMFDDNKYVNDLKGRLAAEAKKAAPEITAEQITAAQARLNACKTLDELGQVFLSMNAAEKKACVTLKDVLKATLTNVPPSGSSNETESSPPPTSDKPSESRREAAKAYSAG